MKLICLFCFAQVQLEDTTTLPLTFCLSEGDGIFLNSSELIGFEIESFWDLKTAEFDLSDRVLVTVFFVCFGEDPEFIVQIHKPANFINYNYKNLNSN